MYAKGGQHDGRKPYLANKFSLFLSLSVHRIVGENNEKAPRVKASNTMIQWSEA